MALSACSSTPEAVALPSAPGSAPLPSSSTAGDEKAAAAAYANFVAMLERADSLPAESRRKQLATVMADPQLSRVLQRIDTMKSHHIATYGHIIVDVKSVQLTASGATVYDCQDSRNSGLMNSQTGKKLNRGVRQGNIKALLVKAADGQWRVSKSITIGEGC
ncbi:hypothetical protein [Actinomadura violacea]|uniref:DUF4440 domain-containing protein n=1 Tax=Actinomadura violacea TaxID=2819934 RepID=A0ABS3SB60_9ACTN|nr:hypothetical protein [Actinomadura violacea]MBO2465993.1 hypothetical protein [Actinomadura violacea]